MNRPTYEELEQKVKELEEEVKKRKRTEGKLQESEEKYRSLLRKSDTVARMGGDEFLLLLPEVTQVEDAAKIAQKTLEVIREPLVVDDHELHITTSIGIAIYPSDGEDAGTLVKNADIAMYYAKKKGRNNYQLFTPA